MIGIVPRVEMRDPNLGRDLRPADRGDGVVKLGMFGIAKPVRIIVVARESGILRILLFAGLHQRLAALGGRSRQPSLLEVRFGESRRRNSGDTEALSYDGMTDVPGVFLGQSRRRSENVPDVARGCAKRGLRADTRKQRRGRESYGRSTEGQLGHGKARRSLHQNTLHRNRSNITFRAGQIPGADPSISKAKGANSSLGHTVLGSHRRRNRSVAQRLKCYNYRDYHNCRTIFDGIPPSRPPDAAPVKIQQIPTARSQARAEATNLRTVNPTHRLPASETPIPSRGGQRRGSRSAIFRSAGNGQNWS